MGTAIGALFLRENNGKKEVFLVNDNDRWLFPGGSKTENETEEECLIREVKEELLGTEIENLRFYKTFKTFSTKHNTKFQVKMYLADPKGKIEGFSGEIAEGAWTSDPEEYPLVDAAPQVIASLREDNLL